MWGEIMNILESIQKILQFGIDLGDCSDKECEDFIANLNWYINQNTSSQANCDENKVVIENFSGVPVLALQIVRNRTLQFIPLAEDDFFESFMSVLEFISTDESVPKKTPTKERLEKRMKLKSNKPEAKKEKPKVTIDDFEWI
jgi:hypothetical protein